MKRENSLFICGILEATNSHKVSLKPFIGTLKGGESTAALELHLRILHCLPAFLWAQRQAECTQV